MDQMPRQVIYSLASRAGPLEKKESIIQNYHGQPKQELLQLIRSEFPLAEEDKRSLNLSAHAIAFLRRAKEHLKNSLCVPSESEKETLRTLLRQLQALVEKL
jgi:hypothetical protein